MEAEARKNHPLETGGVLVGYWNDSKDECVIHEAIGPGPLASHKEDSFEPDGDYQTREIARIYRRSRRVWTYLGDWHVHPDSTSSISRIDRKTLRRIASYGPARAPQPLMMILATTEVAAPCLDAYILRRSWIKSRVTYVPIAYFKRP